MAPTSKSKIPVLDGVVLSRTIIPTIPPTFLSRRHLFPLFGEERSGVTLVVAPSGYGKTTVVAEWVQSQNKPVIWSTFSERDSAESLARLLLQSIYNAIPNFPKRDPKITGTNIDQTVIDFCNDFENLPGEYIWVMDNVEDIDKDFGKTAELFLEILPSNVKLVSIRKFQAVIPSKRYEKVKNFNLITSHNLAFNVEEVESIRRQHEIEDSDADARNLLSSVLGWPAATQLLARKIKQSAGKPLDNLFASEVDPLRALADDVVSRIPSQERELLISLSPIDEFDASTAEFLLGNTNCGPLLNKYSSDGTLLVTTEKTKRIYQFNHAIRQSLEAELSKDPDRKIQAYKKLAQHLVEKEQIDRALEFAKESGDSDLFMAIFTAHGRQMAMRGQGKNLIKWSEHVGLQTGLGAYFGRTIEAFGYLVNFENDRAAVIADQMLLENQGSPIKDYVERFAALIKTHVAFAAGEFEEMEKLAKLALDTEVSTLDIDPAEKLALLRFLASKAFIYESSEELEILYARGKNIIASSAPEFAPFLNYHINAIKAMRDFTQGAYFDAYESASTAVTIAELNDFVGISGSLDAQIVQARCLAEFLRTKEAVTIFEKVRTMSLTWHQIPWYLVVDGYLLREVLSVGQVEQSFEGIRKERELVQNFPGKNNLDSLVDFNETFLRIKVRDFDRANILLGRLPESLSANRLAVLAGHMIGKLTYTERIDRLNAHFPRTQIYKHLGDAEASLGQESIALAHMRKALDIAAQCGAQKVFLYLEPAMLHLILKTAGDRPTVYLEELARKVSEHLKRLDSGSGPLVEPLTKRELEILRNLSTGKPISAIAGTLHVSQNTMKTHLRNIYRKLDTDGRHSAVEKAKSLYLI